jgi:hypothetical protein
MYESRCFSGLFIIHTDQNNIIVKYNRKGMPYLDLSKLEAKVALSFVQTAILFVQTVRGNMEGYTQREVEESHTAHEAQAMLGHPTNQDFLGMLHFRMIANCPVSNCHAKH